MNIREYNKMNMFTAVNAVMQLFGNVTAKIDALSEASEKFNEKLSLIVRRDSQYTTAASGATASKNSAADTLAESTLRIANALLVMGNVTENEQLKAECSLSRSRLSRRRNLELSRISSRITELAREYASDLGGYGITRSDLTSHAAATESFRKLREEQQQRLSEVKSARGLLYDDLSDANGILRNQIDPLMEMIKNSDVEFYNQYRAARVIRNIHGHASKNGTSIVTPDIQTTNAEPVSETAAA